jgi:hypothetical protein
MSFRSTNQPQQKIKLNFYVLNNIEFCKAFGLENVKPVLRIFSRISHQCLKKLAALDINF